MQVPDQTILDFKKTNKELADPNAIVQIYADPQTLDGRTVLRTHQKASDRQQGTFSEQVPYPVCPLNVYFSPPFRADFQVLPVNIVGPFT